jgi:hypothetical protein
MSPPDYTGLLKMLYDWQTIIAGVAAIVGGWIAYRAGVIQAQATRESAAKQIAAADAEIKNADAAAADAIRREVIEFSKFISGNLEICGHIHAGTPAPVPRHDLPSIMKTGIDPVVYPAIADRIGRIPFPQQVVSFYTRIAEAQAIIEIIAKGPAHDTPVTADLAQTIAESFITALQLAKLILQPVSNPNLDEQVLELTQRNIDQALVAAHENFPDAESFT